MQEVIHRHIVQRISFIARDVSDARAFGYVYGCRDGRHQFYGIKTEKVVCAFCYSQKYLSDVQLCAAAAIFATLPPLVRMDQRATVAAAVADSM